MELNASNLAAELKRQMTSELPLDNQPRGIDDITVRTLITSPAEKALCEAALKIMKTELTSAYPAWTVNVDGYAGDSFEVVVCFSR